VKWRCYNRYLCLKLNEICHHHMRFMGSSMSKIRLRPGGPAGGLTALPRPSSWWGGGSKPHHRSRPFGPRASALRVSIFGPSPPRPKNQTSPMGGGKSAGPIKIRLLRPWINLLNDEIAGVDYIVACISRGSLLIMKSHYHYTLQYVPLDQTAWEHKLQVDKKSNNPH